ncbi:glycerophosphodiester phosphodiesterase [Marmoricola sp. RAF53]|uniref:glycerophosphodiester phosphodiesterase n=1 Tax=Marmoricola sp. RAF53 TaxID=3233059 RepID=UPI003F973A5B
MDTPVTGYAYLDAVREGGSRTVLGMAHRGGAEHPELVGLENTAHAFRHAYALGYRYFETDVHLTRDGVLVALHDGVLDRVADSPGAVAEMTAAEVAEVLVGGAHAVPLLADLLAEFPDCRFNIDLKARGTAAPLADLLRRTGAEDRVLVGSFSRAELGRFRRTTAGRVPTSAHPLEVVAFVLSPSARLARLLTRDQVRALQVPVRRGPLPVVTRSLVRRAHAVGVHVHPWTVDDPDEMVRLVDLGVDGIFTDRTDTLKEVLVSRGLWREYA